MSPGLWRQLLAQTDAVRASVADLSEICNGPAVLTYHRDASGNPGSILSVSESYEITVANPAASRSCAASARWQSRGQQAQMSRCTSTYPLPRASL